MASPSISDPASRRIDDQYFVGDDLMVAPLFNDKGDRKVYLPKGLWYDFFNEQQPEAGGRELERSAVPLHVVLAAARQLEERRLALREGLDLVLTEEGREAAERLAKAREESLAELLGDWWGPDRPTDLARLVEELNAEMCGSDAERPHDGSGDRRRPSSRGGAPGRACSRSPWCAACA